MGKIISFEEYRKRKELEKEKEENRRIYATIASNISHLVNRNPKEGSNGNEETEKS